MSKRKRCNVDTVAVIINTTNSPFAKLSVFRSAPPRHKGDNTEAANNCNGRTRIDPEAYGLEYAGLKWPRRAMPG